MGPSPAVADVRNAVRDSLRDLGSGSLVLAACSGGADSLSLAAALAFVAPRERLRAGGVTVDHGLQPGSADRARDVAAALTRLGLDPVECVPISVPRNGKQGGPEAAARTARYDALAAVAERTGAAAILLGHTLDDQAETVLLGLARGSGARALAGMAARRDRYRRPLLNVRRATTRAACAALDLPVWDDPHNTSPRFARARVRHEVMPVLEAALGPGVAEALARTAGQLRADADFLDVLAEMEAERACAGRDYLAYRAPRRVAAGSAHAGAAQCGGRRRLPGRRADRGPRGAARGAGDKMARAAMGRPPRRRTRAPAGWPAAAYPRQRSGRGQPGRFRTYGRCRQRRAGVGQGGWPWTRATWGQT